MTAAADAGPKAMDPSRARILRVEAAVALGAVAFWVLLTGVLTQVGYDAVTYLAAGQRLNAGHALYALAPGDLYVAPNLPYYSVPLLYPPLIAVLWRPLAMLPPITGLWLYLTADALAMLWAVLYVLRGLRPAAIAVVAACSIGIGLQLTIGNIAGFFVAGMVICWVYRDRPWIGAIVGLMVILKITPAVFVFWLIGQRNWRALAWCAGAIVVGLVIGIAGAGIDAHLAYLDVLRSAVPQPWSLSGMTHIGAATTIAEVVGCIAILLTRKNAALSYRVAVLTMVLGSPAIGFQTPALLIALVAPGSEHRQLAAAKEAPLDTPVTQGLAA